MPGTAHPIIDTAVFFDENEFAEQLANSKQPIAVFKNALTSMRECMDTEFSKGIEIEQLIYGRSQILDFLLYSAWGMFNWPADRKVS